MIRFIVTLLALVAGVAAESTCPASDFEHGVLLTVDGDATLATPSELEIIASNFVTIYNAAASAGCASEGNYTVASAQIDVESSTVVSIIVGGSCAGCPGVSALFENSVTGSAPAGNCSCALTNSTEFLELFDASIDFVVANGGLENITNATAITEVNPVSCETDITPFTSDTIFISFEGDFTAANVFLGDSIVIENVTKAYMDTYNSLQASGCDPQFKMLTSVALGTSFERTTIDTFEVQVIVEGQCRGCNAFEDIFSSGRRRLAAHTTTCFCPIEALTLGAPTEADFLIALNAALAGTPGVPVATAVTTKQGMPSSAPSIAPSVAPSAFNQEAFDTVVAFPFVVDQTVFGSPADPAQETPPEYKLDGSERILTPGTYFGNRQEDGLRFRFEFEALLAPWEDIQATINVTFPSTLEGDLVNGTIVGPTGVEVQVEATISLEEIDDGSTIVLLTVTEDPNEEQRRRLQALPEIPNRCSPDVVPTGIARAQALCSVPVDVVDIGGTSCSTILDSSIAQIGALQETRLAAIEERDFIIQRSARRFGFSLLIIRQFCFIRYNPISIFLGLPQRFPFTSVTIISSTGVPDSDTYNFLGFFSQFQCNLGLRVEAIRIFVNRIDTARSDASRTVTDLLAQQTSLCESHYNLVADSTSGCVACNVPVTSSPTTTFSPSLTPTETASNQPTGIAPTASFAPSKSDGPTTFTLRRGLEEEDYFPEDKVVADEEDSQFNVEKLLSHLIIGQVEE